MKSLINCKGNSNLNASIEGETSSSKMRWSNTLRIDKFSSMAAIIVYVATLAKSAVADTYTDNRDLTWDYSYSSILKGAVVNSARGFFWFPGMEDPVTTPIGDVRIPSQFPNNNPQVLHYNIPTVKIGYRAFEHCDRLTEIIMPSSIIGIEDYAFHACTNLRNVATTYVTEGVELHEGLLSVGNYAFSECTQLSKVTIPDSVTYLGAGAFEDCVNLTCVAVGRGVINASANIFHGCSNIREAKIPQQLCFGKMSDIFPDAYQQITNIVMIGSVTNIGDYAFSNCKN